MAVYVTLASGRNEVHDAGVAVQVVDGHLLVSTDAEDFEPDRIVGIHAPNAWGLVKVENSKA